MVKLSNVGHFNTEYYDVFHKISRYHVLDAFKHCGRSYDHVRGTSIPVTRLAVRMRPVCRSLFVVDLGSRLKINSVTVI